MNFLKCLLLLPFSSVCFANIVGTVEAKGLFVKDKIEVIGFNDPTMQGVACYTTRYIRPMSFENDSTNSSLACRKVGKISGKLVDMPNVFSQNKAFLSLNKETVVDRFYDKTRNVLVYLSYTKSWGDNNTSHSLSVVPVGE